jgi:type IV pilus assembly protein PilO
MKIDGRYAAIKSFLTDLQNNPELIVVDGFSLTNSDPFEENVVMDLHVTVYLREGA